MDGSQRWPMCDIPRTCSSKVAHQIRPYSPVLCPCSKYICSGGYTRALRSPLRHPVSLPCPQRKSRRFSPALTAGRASSSFLGATLMCLTSLSTWASCSVVGRRPADTTLSPGCLTSPRSALWTLRSTGKWRPRTVRYSVNSPCSIVGKV